MALDPVQQAAVEQLWAVTSSTTAAAKERDERVLREHGWNVEAAANAIFSDAPGTSVGSQPSRTPSSPDGFLGPQAPPGARRLSGSGPRRPPASTASVGLGLWGVISFPVRLIFGLLAGTWYFLIRTFVPISLLPRLPRFLLPPSGGSTSRSLRNPDPTTTSLNFVRELEIFTGASAQTGTLPDFYVGPYREFMTHVRKEGKVGMVVLVCGEHEDDEEFKRGVLCDRELVGVLKDKDVLIWGADIRSREGYQVSQTLLATTFPAITFVSLLSGGPQSSSTSSARLQVIATLSGPPSTTTSASSIIQILTDQVLPRATPFLNRLRAERFTLEEARHLREEQDRAFREAERRDRERMEAERQRKELERHKAEREAREIAERKKRVDDRRVWRRYARKHLLPPSTGSIRVAVRTPLSAERNVRQFEPGSSTLPLFIYAETLLIPSSDDPSADPDSPPEGYEPEWDFRIVTTFPRKEIEKVETGGEVIWDVVKGAGGALFAEKVEGGVWGEAEAKELNGEESDEEIEE